jgi:hypothetical protein
MKALQQEALGKMLGGIEMRWWDNIEQVPNSRSLPLPQRWSNRSDLLSLLAPPLQPMPSPSSSPTSSSTPFPSTSSNVSLSRRLLPILTLPPSLRNRKPRRKPPSMSFSSTTLLPRPPFTSHSRPSRRTIPSTFLRRARTLARWRWEIGWRSARVRTA